MKDRKNLINFDSKYYLYISILGEIFENIKKFNYLRVCREFVLLFLSLYLLVKLIYIYI